VFDFSQLELMMRDENMSYLQNRSIIIAIKVAMRQFMGYIRIYRRNSEFWMAEWMWSWSKYMYLMFFVLQISKPNIIVCLYKHAWKQKYLYSQATASEFIYRTFCMRYVLQISKPNILGLYIYTEHDTVASLPCAFIRGSYIVNQILCKIKLMYQQYLYYCSVERSNSQPTRIYCLFKTITDNQIFRIVSTLDTETPYTRGENKFKSEAKFTLCVHTARMKSDTCARLGIQ
jgi:hypothetical protein